ncbi:MAG TPA: MFS transporter [Alloacidobacterium sp.]|nr:MFS transporter [Alloacidobacterium sp.]
MDSRKLEKRRIFAITWITYAGFYFCRKNLSIVLPMLHGMPGMGNFELANIVFGYSLLYAIGQFGCGFLSDYFGPGKVVGTGLVLVVGSNIFMGLHASPLWLLAFACVNGVGQSTGWSGLVKMMASWFSSHQRGIVMAWWGTNYVLGGFLATAFATWAGAQHLIAPQLGWRRGFLFPAFILLIITVGFFVFAKDSPEELTGAAEAKGDTAAIRKDRSSWSDLAALLRSRSIWTIGSAYFFLELFRYALMFWLPFYMVNHLRYSLQTSGYVSSLYELAGIGGALLAGYVSDRFMQSRRAPISAIMLCGLAVVALGQLMLAEHGILGTAIAVSLAGVLSYGPDTLLSGAAAQDIGEVKAAATASGLIDGIGHLGALFSPYLVVYVSGRYGWDRLFVVFAAAAFVAAAALIPVWNLRPAELQEAQS